MLLKQLLVLYSYNKGTSMYCCRCCCSSMQWSNHTCLLASNTHAPHSLAASRSARHKRYEAVCQSNQCSNRHKRHKFIHAWHCAFICRSLCQDYELASAFQEHMLCRVQVLFVQTHSISWALAQYPAYADLNSQILS